MVTGRILLVEDLCAQEWAHIGALAPILGQSIEHNAHKWASLANLGDVEGTRRSPRSKSPAGASARRRPFRRRRPSGFVYTHKWAQLDGRAPILGRQIEHNAQKWAQAEPNAPDMGASSYGDVFAPLKTR